MRALTGSTAVKEVEPGVISPEGESASCVRADDCSFLLGGMVAVWSWYAGWLDALHVTSHFSAVRT
jgi:hypothetical protein